jgi:trimethylamine--corrinoid protein Co-methyltransferase
MQRYQVVSLNDIERIHETSLRIMEEIGVVFSYEPARNILAKGGAKIDGKTVRFPREMVERNLKNIPSSFKLHARNPQKNVEINTRDTAFAGPYGSPFVLDLDKGRRYSSMEDFNNLAKLCQMLDNIDIQSHIYCEPNDVDEKIRHLEMMYYALKYNEKPLMGGVLGYQESKDCIELAAIAHGGPDAIRAKPIMASIPCALTPLSYDDKMAGAIIAYAEYGQPQLVNSLSIAGATNVCTIAGSITLQNAEILAGIVLAQLVNPGTPIVYSASGSNAEMRNGSLSVGSPEDTLFSLINGQLAKYYDLPCRISGALSDSKCVDAQAGYETMMTLLMAQMAGGNFILHGAGILEAYTCTSFEKLMIDDEAIGMVRRIGRGVEVNEETLAFDVIKEVGPQGAFIDHDHTFEHFRTEFYQPVMSDRNNQVAWKEQGSLTAEQRANARWKKLLSEYEEPKLPADVERDLRKFIEKRT